MCGHVFGSFTLNFTVFNNGPEVFGGCKRQTMRPDIFDNVIGRKKLNLPFNNLIISLHCQNVTFKVIPMNMWTLGRKGRVR